MTAPDMIPADLVAELLAAIHDATDRRRAVRLASARISAGKARWCGDAYDRARADQAEDVHGIVKAVLAARKYTDGALTESGVSVTTEMLREQVGRDDEQVAELRDRAATETAEASQ